LKVRIVETETEPRRATGVCQLPHGIAAKRTIRDGEGVGLRAEHGEAFMMFGRDDDIAHASRPGEIHKGRRIEMARVEVAGQTPVFGDRNAGHGRMHHPFADAVIGLPMPPAGQ
jgi:hypothetical protein